MGKKYSELADGTVVRFTHLKGTGWQYVTEIQSGKIVGPNDELQTPRGAAVDLDNMIRGEDGHGSWGPEWWECFTVDGWVELES
jgi:hypothetical protein